MKSASAEASQDTGTSVEATDDTGHDPELAKWQKTLLPVMTLFVIALATLFFILSTNALRGVGVFVQSEHGELREQIKTIIGQPRPSDTADDSIRRGLYRLA